MKHGGCLRAIQGVLAVVRVPQPCRGSPARTAAPGPGPPPAARRPALTQWAGIGGRGKRAAVTRRADARERRGEAGRERRSVPLSEPGPRAGRTDAPELA